MIEPHAPETTDLDGRAWSSWLATPRSASGCKRRWHWAIAVAKSPPRSMPWERSPPKDADDPWMRLAILSGLAESALAFIPLCDRIPSASGRAQLLAQAAAIVGVRRRATELSALLGMIASRLDQGQTKSGPGVSIDALTMLAGLAEGLERSGPPLHAVIATAPPDLKPHLERLAPLWPAASALAVSDRPIAERLVALDVLSRGRPDLAEEIIPNLLAVTQPGEIQSAAARAVGRAGRPSLAAKALDRWNDLALATRRELLSALAGSSVLAEPLIKALERSAIAPGELDASTREALERLPDAVLRQRASAVLAKFAPPQRSEALARYQAALKLVARRASRCGRLCPELPDLPPAPGPGPSRRPRSFGHRRPRPRGPPDRHPGPQSRGRSRLRDPLAGHPARPGRLGTARRRDRHDFEAPPRRRDRGNHPPIRDR